MLTGHIRDDFPCLRQERNGKPPVYFDNACMTLKPNPVVDAMMNYYRYFPGCSGHRSQHWFAEEVGQRVQQAREDIAKLINARSPREIIFTRNTSEGINLIARSFRFRQGDIVLTTDREHNSNLCPWRNLEAEGIIRHYPIFSNADNTFSIEQLKHALSERVRLVSLVHTSNLDGYTIPAEEIIRVCRSYNPQIRILLDGAQSVPHQVVDVQKLDVDFLAFSVHKMCGPTGMGVLYVKQEWLADPKTNQESLKYFLVGGGTVEDTTLNGFPDYLSAPEGFEAGLQDYAGIIGAGAAARYVMGIGREQIALHEHELNKYLTNQLARHEEIEIIGPQDPVLRGSVICFFARKTGLAEYIVDWYDRYNIMVRAGWFCVHSWFNMKKAIRDFPAIRASLYCYNTLAECKTFAEVTSLAIKDFNEKHPNR
ncbi:MAG: aminotransferase class V-fold PLP-dependent enzyme, partial [Chloroflexi bacterium]|nr:aminotransferase class V-fold PLP-dependent enzyme [Chloroflexota bacterium]